MRTTDLENACRRHVLTVSLEDYFQVGAFSKLIQRHQWYRFETRLERNTERVLQLLDQFGIKATFFAMGWNADKFPEVIQRVASRGHEIASMGYYHRRINEMTPEEYRDDLARAREALEKAAGKKVLGYRVAHGWFSASDLWALDVLAEEGYSYDASINPMFRRFAHEKWRRFLHKHQFKNHELWEFPLSTWNCLGWNIPIAGGNYHRQLPHILVKRLVQRWHRSQEAPFVMYFNIWELDPDQPRINVLSPLTRMRHYRNLSKMVRRLEGYFDRYRFAGIADYLGLQSSQAGSLAPVQERMLSSPAGFFMQEPAGLTSEAQSATAPLPPVSNQPIKVAIVVPCYNEKTVLPFLANTLKSVQANLQPKYELQFLFVDDGSRDGTWERLDAEFGSWSNCTLLRHEKNLGVAAAILTGIRRADCEIVCSIDCDCTYDPHDLAEMIPLLVEGIDLVTASPYHPKGSVRNVPHWRLGLSKSASFLYRRVLTNKLHTYTSCFRVYRRSAFVGMNIRSTGYLGIAEMIATLDGRGAAITEYPTTLEVRLMGHSKIKIWRTIFGHLRLLSRLTSTKLLRQAKPAWLARSKCASTQPSTTPNGCRHQPHAQRTPV